MDSQISSPQVDERHLKRINSKDMSDKVQTEAPLEHSGMGFWQRSAMKVLNLPGFDHVMGLIIVVNMAVMIIDINEGASDEEGSDEIAWTDVFGWFVLIIFVFELLARLIALQCLFWSDYWNIGDFVVVTVDVAFSVVGIAAEELFPVSILRIFRLAKLARVSKVLRVFPELRLLLAGLVSSMRAIFWGTVLVGLFLLVWSMMAVLLIHPMVKDVDFDGCSRCERAYSTVWQACLTFWQQIVTGDSWGAATIPVIEAHPVTILFFVPVFLSIGLAVMNLMLGVVVTVAQSAYESELEEVHAAKALVKLQHESNVLELCQKMDTDHDGVLSREEIHAGFVSEGPFHDAMEALGISNDDFEIAWAVLDSDASGSVSYKEFVTCLCTMKSSDTHFMITYIKYYITWMKGALLQQINEKHNETMNIETKLEETLQLVERQEESVLHEEERILNRLGVSDAEPEPTRHGEEGDKDKQILSNDCDKSNLPEKNSPSRTLNPAYGYLLRSTVPATSKSLKPASADSAMEACLQKVGDEIEVLRNELKDSLKGIDRRLCQQISRIQAKQQVAPGGARILPNDAVPKGASNLSQQKGGETVLEVKSISSTLQHQSGGFRGAVSLVLPDNLVNM